MIRTVGGNLLAGAFVIGLTVGCSATSTYIVDRPSGQASSNISTRAPVSAAAGAPGTTGATGAAGATLDGVYRRFEDYPNMLVNGVKDPSGGPAETYWWAYRSACLAQGCVATGISLDDVNHNVAATPERTRVVNLVNGARQYTVDGSAPCAANAGRAETYRAVYRLAPQPDGTLSGEATRTVADNGCGRQGAVVVIPTSFTREGDVPPGVKIADPATATG